jgi:hypothetical protein
MAQRIIPCQRSFVYTELSRCAGKAWRGIGRSPALACEWGERDLMQDDLQQQDSDSHGGADCHVERELARRVLSADTCE